MPKPEAKQFEQVVYLKELHMISESPPVAILPNLSGCLNHGMSIGTGVEDMAAVNNTAEELSGKTAAFLKAAGITDGPRTLMLANSGEIEFAVPSAKEIKASALISNHTGHVLMIKPADCPVVLIHGGATDNHLALVHAGRADLNSGIVFRTVAAMQKLGCRNFRAGVLPGIGNKNYFVQAADNLIDQNFWREFSAAHGNGRIYLDLTSMAINQLLTAGVAAPNISAYGDGIDTYELAQENPPRSFSYRWATVAGLSQEMKQRRMLVAAQLKA